MSAIGKQFPDDFALGIQDTDLTLSGAGMWNSPSILYVLTPLSVSIDAGEKKSCQLLLVIIDVLGAAAQSFQIETQTDFKLVRDLVLLIEMTVLTNN